MSRPILSVLIPTRNRAQYLRYAIQSACNIARSDIEIIVSENHGSDDAYSVAKSFADFRVIVVRPPRPLPMHENFEHALSHATGRWVTAIGDDDAVMPWCADYLEYIESRYPQAEAVASARAYYFWRGAYAADQPSHCRMTLVHREAWADSQQRLAQCLHGDIDYIYTPQMYGGGFQRRSLVERVRRVQGGIYHRSITPDAYSALMGMLHTYRYLEVGVPLTWVGTSPVAGGPKDRAADFWGMHEEQPHEALGGCQGDMPFFYWFFEAYLSAQPFTSPAVLCLKNVEHLYRVCASRLLARGDVTLARHLADSLGFAPLTEPLDHCVVPAVTNPQQSSGDVVAAWQAHADECPDILSSDDAVGELWRDYARKYLRC